MRTRVICGYCGDVCDPKIKQGKGHPDDWTRDGPGNSGQDTYHVRCLPGD